MLRDDQQVELLIEKPVAGGRMLARHEGQVVLVAGTYSRGSSAAVVVGSKNFTEQVVLGEILAQAVERTGLTVERRLNLGGTLVCDQALRAGDIDVYPEYTGTALTALFKEALPNAGAPGAANPSPSDRVLDIVREKYGARGITMLPPLGFNNTFAILVRAAAAREQNLAKVSDLARVAPSWTAVGSPDAALAEAL